MKDYYATLGVAKNANDEEIKKAYRKLASQYHPDKEGGNTQRFQEIQEAYSVLSDAQKRSMYDNPQPQFRGFGPQTQGFNLDEIFNMFGVNIRSGGVSHTARVTLWINLEDVASGGMRVVSLRTPRGVTNAEINIPQGIEDGNSVRYPKLVDGNDVIVTFRVKPHAQWQREGNNLTMEIVVDFWQLILGTQISIANILGNKFILTIPPKTNPGSLLRMKGQGLASNKLHDPRGQNGDLLIRIQGRVPDTISESLLEAIRKETQ